MDLVYIFPLDIFHLLEVVTDWAVTGPSTHPVKIPQLFYETVWNTVPFNDPSLWPEDGSQPFVWSYGDP